MGLGNIALDVGSAGKGNPSQIADIITFVEAPWGLNGTLFPVQKVILKAHYGLPLDDVNKFPVTDFRRQNERMMTEAEYLRYLYDEGRSNIAEVEVGHERREMVLSIGRRSGKTHIASCIAAYETYKLILKGDPQAYYGLPNGEVIGIISVATDKNQAGILFSKVSGYYKDCAFFAPYTANNTMSYARFQTPADIQRYGRYEDDEKANATIRIAFSPCRARGLRGPGNLVIILDELAHFTDTGQSAAEDVYNAITPSISAFSPKDPNDRRVAIGEVEGRIISISSPLGRQGQFYKLFQLGFRPGMDNMLCIQAPTWEVNPTVPANEFEKHYLKNPTVFFTEYGGQFTNRTTGWIKNPEDLFACVDSELRPQRRAQTRKPHFVGFDLGLVNDGSAVAIVHLDDQGRIVLDYIDQIKAGEGKYANQERLELEDVADWLYDLSRKFYISQGIFDQWNGIPFHQALLRRGLKQFESVQFTKPLRSQLFKNFLDMMTDGRLVLYDWPKPSADDGEAGNDHCPYIRELLELQEHTHTMYITDVRAPNIEGKHDDLSDALVRAVWCASQHIVKPTHIAGARSRIVSPGQATQTASQQRRAFLKSKIPGGSSPDRQPFRRGWTRGR